MVNLSFLTRSKSLLFLLALLEFSQYAHAGPGDTTWVTVFQDMKLTHHGNYDTTVAYPTGKRYRKIKMHYILGRYTCGGAQYCGSWDYTTKVYALPKNHDTVEIARIITPYASDWHVTNKTHDYVVEVTDYASILEDSTHMRFIYDGYSWGFTLTLKLEMIEGIPPMDALSVKNIYDGYFAYGNASNPIENHLSAKTLSYSTARAFIKNSVSGHGADNTGCSEFCSKYYSLMINNNQLAQKQIWRDDCGYNQVYPQTGTWVFDRSNWCPGAVVWPIYHDLKNATTSNSSFTADIDMQPYVNANPSGGFNFVSQLISYSDFNFSTDVSLEDIVAPSTDKNYHRDNPACRNPVLKVRNTGASTVTAIVFEYGISGLTPSTFTWSGTMAPLETSDIVLPTSAAVMAQSVSVQFEAKIVSANNIADEYADNNQLYSKTTPVKKLPSDIIVKLGTNGSINPITGYSETTWQLFDELDNLVAQRTNGGANTSYADTVSSLYPGCYKFVVKDAGCDGYQWWFFQNYNPNPGTGTLRIDDLSNTPKVYFPGDVGCGFTSYFYVGDYPAPPPPVDPVALTQNVALNQLEVYPNPASGTAIVKINLMRRAPVDCKILDPEGRVLHRAQLGEVDLFYHKLDISDLAPGLYLVEITPKGSVPVVKKLLVQ